MLCLFGRPALTIPSGDRVDLSPSGWRLLAAVAMAPTEGISRTNLATLVLPTAKLSTLRKLVWDVRKVLDGTGLDLLDVDADALRFSDRVYCDVRDLRATRPKRAFRDIYRGLFFDTASTFRHDPWTIWLAQQRKNLLDLYVSRVTDYLASVDGDRTTRSQEARHLLRFSPDHTVATQVLMFEAARTSDAEEVRHRFDDLQAVRRIDGGRADRRTTDVLHRLIGSSQRHLGAPHSPGPMDLPTIYISMPSAEVMSKSGRMLRSLLVDITIGLCRASLFRVIASDHDDFVVLCPFRAAEPVTSKAYVVATSILDHVLGPQIVFTLMSHPKRQILWTEKVEATVDLSVAAYNLLTAGVLRSLIERIKDVEIESFQLDVDPGAYALYLAGYSSLTSLDLVQLRRGRNHLRRSMSQSPGFAPTHECARAELPAGMAGHRSR